MATRPTPPVTQVIDALKRSRSHGLGDPEAGDPRVISWDDAEGVVKRAFRTTYRKASEWLLDIVIQPDSPLVALTNSGTLFGPMKDGKATRVDLGWDMELAVSMRFDPYAGKLTEGRGLTPLPAPWLTLRSSVEVIHAQLRENAVAARLAREAKQAVEDSQFRELHGEAYDAIVAWLSTMDRTGVNRALAATLETVIRTSTFDTSRHFGTPGALTIDLRGVEIEAFAKLIENTKGGANEAG